MIKKFEKIANKYKDKIAISSERKSLSYQELNETSNRIANTILKLSPNTDLDEEKTVLLLFEHNINAVLGIMAVLKLQRVYVPMYSTYPKERIFEILDDSEADIIITDKNSIDLAKDLRALSSKNIDIINVDEIDINTSILNPEIKSKQDQGAYIIYTSGSTGKPKGVLQTCKNIDFYTENYIKELKINEKDRFTFLSSFCHDGTVEDVYPALWSGAQLCMLDIKKINGIEEMITWIKDKKITVYHSVPSVFRFFTSLLETEKFEKMRLIVMGAEALRDDDLLAVKRFFPNTKLYHMYGQTEASVNTMGLVDLDKGAERVSLGKNFDGVKLLLLDEEGKEVKKGEIGEIYVASPYLALRYWKNEIETEKVFKLDPIYGRIYKTGDLGLEIEDKTIKFMGRKDYQVKIRGFRVELGEIESKMKEIEFIKQAVVVDKYEGENKQLYSFITVEKKIDLIEIKRILKEKLPDYMVPISIEVLNKIPVTLSGKVDRKKLKEMKFNIGQEKIEYPQNIMEELMLDIYKKTLKIKDEIGIENDFFELGGNSLLVLEFINEAKKYGIPLKYLDLYEYKTVKDLSNYLKENNEGIEEKVTYEKKIDQEEEINSKILSTFPHEDKYSIRELDCFYRPVLILHNEINKEYADIFLLYFNYYNSYVVDGHFLEDAYENDITPKTCFLKFYNDVLKNKLGIEAVETKFLDEEDMHLNIQKKIDANIPILIGMDLFYLNYASIYMEKHQGHYFLIKGYDRDKRIYYILDNMHIDGGVGTAYKEFIINFDGLYKMVEGFYEEDYFKSEYKAFISFEKTNDFSEKEYNSVNCILDISENFKNINAEKIKVDYLEKLAVKAIEKNSNKLVCGILIARSNWRHIYYDLLLKIIAEIISDSKRNKSLEEMITEVKEKWNNIKMKIFQKIVDSDFDFSELKIEIEKVIEIEKKYRQKVIELSKELKLDKKKDLKNFFKEKNNNKAIIKEKNDTIEMEIEKGKNYNTWHATDNAPQMLRCPENSEQFEFEIKHILRNKKVFDFSGTNSGIILKMVSGKKYMFGVVQEESIAVLCPENKTGSSLYYKLEHLMESEICFKIKKLKEVISFFTKKSNEEIWEEILNIKEKEGIEEFGLFARTWEGVNYKVEFSDILYKSRDILYKYRNTLQE